MRNKSQGLMATLLMFVPLLAVPFLAAWGVPWLSAKAKSEGLEIGGSSLFDSGVGQSKSGRHRAADLFAPVSSEPVVDLNLPADLDVFEKPHAATQNPHLRNASLVVAREEAWVDPFDRIEPLPVNNATAAPQRAVGEWSRDESFAETPAPREYGELPIEKNGTPANNPFAEFESEPGRVAVNGNAFTDPALEPSGNEGGDELTRHPEPPGNRGSGADASRTLFADAETPAPRRQAALEPAEIPPERTANANETSPAKPEPLTWDKARSRLKAYGITHFYLQPDPKGELYHFRCAYSPGQDSRINRLFEAEAAEPLEAVRKVLVQIESSTVREN
jgi:hypothetical protein